MNFNYPEFLPEEGEIPGVHPLKSPPLLPSNQPATFTLPAELQGGIGTILLRRPSYAAESFTRQGLLPFTPGQPQQLPLLTMAPYLQFFAPQQRMLLFAIMNNANQFVLGLDLVGESLGNLNLDGYSDFLSFRSQLTLGPAGPGTPAGSGLRSASTSGGGATAPSANSPGVPSASSSQKGISLENGLMLKNQYIVALPDLKAVYSKTMAYFQDPAVTASIISRINELLTQPPVVKLITFIKNLNNLTFHHKILCLVINKNGKFDLLSYPTNSNIFLQKDDLVIVDGDRGKDLVMIVEPLVNLNFAILFNFLKKLEHLKSLTITEKSGRQNQKANGTHPTSMDALAIINLHTNEDNEFVITLPTKQVLRFATPKEVHKISGKFLEEKKAFITCYNKINELDLAGDLQLINVEYQLDYKKLIFYYFAGFKRIDFRGLIKELFKIYKTRIWLCAVLPYDRPQLYVTMVPRLQGRQPVADKLKLHQHATIPHEYELSNDQILNFSIGEFGLLAKPSYFHSANLANLIGHLENEVSGHFYGFNDGNEASGGTSGPGAAASNLEPTFNPFDEKIFKRNFQMKS